MGSWLRSMRRILLVCAISPILGCGSKYEPEDPPTTDGTTTASGDSDSGSNTTGGDETSTTTDCDKLGAFTTNISSAVDRTCATQNCHNAVKISGSTLTAGDHDNNRKALLAFTATDANTLFNKISINGQSHGGGDLSTTLPLARIQAWLTEEARCP